MADASDDGSRGMTLDEWMEQRDAELLANYTPGTYTTKAVDKMGLSGVNTPNRSSIAGSRPESKKSNRTTFSLPEVEDHENTATGTYTTKLITTSSYNDPAHIGGSVSRASGISALTSAGGGGADEDNGPSMPLPLFLASKLNKQLVEAKRAHRLESSWLRGELVRRKKDMGRVRAIIKSKDEQLSNLAAQIEELTKSIKEKDSLLSRGGGGSAGGGGFVPADLSAGGRPLSPDSASPCGLSGSEFAEVM